MRCCPIHEEFNETNKIFKIYSVEFCCLTASMIIFGVVKPVCFPLSPPSPKLLSYSPAPSRAGCSPPAHGHPGTSLSSLVPLVSVLCWASCSLDPMSSLSCLSPLFVELPEKGYMGDKILLRARVSENAFILSHI